VTGLDTNVLVRYLTQDHPAQSKRANAVVAETIASGERVFVSTIVLCELVWVLRGPYGFEKARVVDALERLLATTQLEVDQKDVVRQALEDYADGSGDFADYVIGRRGQEGGCERTVSFDQKLKGSELFAVLAA
jgi:predicted nucleic-acid-binding protein